MSIAGEYENIPSRGADWPHCCDFGADTCDGLRWAAMALKSFKIAAKCPISLHRVAGPFSTCSSQHLTGWECYHISIAIHNKKNYIPLQRQPLRVGVARWVTPPTRRFPLPIPTCWHLKTLTDPMRNPGDPMQTSMAQRNPPMLVSGIYVALGLLELGLALGMYLSCCLCQFQLCWVANANAVFSGIWA